MRKTVVTSFIFFFLLFGLYSQSVKTDSILQLLSTDKQDTTKVLHLIKLCWEYKNLGENEKGLTSGNEALKLSEKLHYKKGIAAALKNIGNIYHNQGAYDKALQTFISSLKIEQELGDKFEMATSYNNIGVIYLMMENTAQAIENHSAALKIRKEMMDEVKKTGKTVPVSVLRDIGASYHNMGIVYWKQLNYDKAIEQFYSSMEMRKEAGDKAGIAYSYIGIGVIYEQQNKLDESLESYFASLRICRELNDKVGIGSCYTNIGNVFKKKKQYDKSLEYAKLTLSTAKEIDYKDLIKEAYANLSEVSKLMNNYQKAYEYQVLLSEIKDSLYNETKSKQLAEVQTKFETEKKEQEIELLNKDKELQKTDLQKQRIITYTVIGGLLLMALVSVVIFRSLKITQRQKKVIEKVRDEIALKNKIVEDQKLQVEEHQKAIIDSITYARRIQQSQLPTEQYIDRSLKRLNKKNV
jgi:tetratricopeptide (TPR) repeat protein